MDSFSTAEEVREMRDRMAELVAGFDGANSTVFSTKDHVSHTPGLDSLEPCFVTLRFFSTYNYVAIACTSLYLVEKNSLLVELHICLCYIARSIDYVSLLWFVYFVTYGIHTLIILTIEHNLDVVCFFCRCSGS